MKKVRKAKNKDMRKFFCAVIKQYKYYSDKRYSTIAGTLVYFLLMSITPFMLWLTLVLGSMDLEGILSHEIFVGISPLLQYLKESAESAAGGAGIILLITSLYSSTNFFYHLRRSGEIIYGSRRVKGGIRLRIISLFLIIAVIALFAVLTGLTVVGTRFLELLIPPVLSDALSCMFMTAVAFAVALVLNLFACPYKMKVKEALSGSLLTTALWLIFAMGFTVYLSFANPERLYGKIASVIIFLLWCYMMMNCFVVGMINNGSFVNKRQYKMML